MSKDKNKDNPEEIDPKDIKPMSTYDQQSAFEEDIWRLIVRYQGEEFELPDANIIYVFENVKVRMLEEFDIGTEMLDNDDDEDNTESWKA
ncbi:MAG: hypothetical protein CMF45_08805 [Legionellales bacterium]|nr:hypothetical protein [Legionellales bacterium]|tara:strand:+ start:213 stop:482 length:270 start_codon:yes stop_codon:yes gene_type:complete